MNKEGKRRYKKEMNKIMRAAGELRQFGYDMPKVFRAIADNIEKSQPECENDPPDLPSAEIIIFPNCPRGKPAKK